MALCASPGRAQTVSSRPQAFNLQLFEAATSSRALLTLDLPEVAPHLALTASLWGNYASTVLRAEDPVVRGATQVEAHVALGLFQLFEVGFALPVVHQRVTLFTGSCARPGVNTCPTAGDSSPGTSLGDMRAYVKVPLVRGRTALAVRLGVGFPSGNDEAYAGAAYWTFSPALLAARAFGPLTVAANLGLRLNEANASPILAVNDELTAGLGLRYDVSWRFGHVRMTVGFDLPFTALGDVPARRADEHDVAPRSLSMWSVRFGLGGEYRFGDVVPFVDLQGSAQRVFTTVVVDGHPHDYSATRFGFSARAGLRVHLRKWFFVTASGEYGLVGATVWAADLGVGFRIGS